MKDSKCVELVPEDKIGSNINFGFSVTQDAIGTFVAIGGPLDNSSNGAAWVFSLDSNNILSQKKLTGRNAIGQSQLGYSVSQILLS